MMGATASESVSAPELPTARGPLSAAVRDAFLDAAATKAILRHASAAVDDADPFGDDLQLAMYCCYELHYRGFAGVVDEMEWDPALLELRRHLETAFLAALYDDTPGGAGLDTELDALLVEPVDAHGVTHHLRHSGTHQQLREYIAHRSLYHLKEADPQAWVIPRLTGAARTGLVTIEYDEYGSGDPDRMHARMFARMMTELGLCADYGAYLDGSPAAALAEVNFMTLCGLHRRLRGALVGQFATVELTSSPGSERLVKAMRRLGCRPSALEFYSEHVEADAVHEQLVRHGVIAPLLKTEPELTEDVVFGIQASNLLADRLSDLLLTRWANNEYALPDPSLIT